MRHLFSKVVQLILKWSNETLILTVKGDMFGFSADGKQKLDMMNIKL